jgi:hypothetical protein
LYFNDAANFAAWEVNVLFSISVQGCSDATWTDNMAKNANNRKIFIIIFEVNFFFLVWDKALYYISDFFFVMSALDLIETSQKQ